MVKQAYDTKMKIMHVIETKKAKKTHKANHIM